eukprot:COSAG01_NODE_1510_length_10078_cov_424.420910_7_plen_131_part_00
MLCPSAGSRVAVSRRDARGGLEGGGGEPRAHGASAEAQSEHTHASLKLMCWHGRWARSASPPPPVPVRDDGEGPPSSCVMGLAEMEIGSKEQVDSGGGGGGGGPAEAEVADGCSATLCHTRTVRTHGPGS